MKRSATERDALIGAKIRTARSLRGYSGVKVAKVLGISVQQYSKYESGKNRVPVTTLLDIATLLGCGLEELVGAPLSTSDAPSLERHETSHILALRSIPSPVRTEIISLIKRLADQFNV